MQCFDESYQNIHLMKLDVYIKVCHGSNKNLFRNQPYQIIEGHGPCSRTRRYVYHGIYHEYPHDQKENYMLHDQKLFTIHIPMLAFPRTPQQRVPVPGQGQRRHQARSRSFSVVGGHRKALGDQLGSQPGSQPHQSFQCF